MDSQVAAAVREYIVANFLYMRPSVDFGEHESLLGRGIIDSLGVVELVMFLQDRFAIGIEDEEITEENLGTLASIVRFVSGKGGSSPTIS